MSDVTSISTVTGRKKVVNVIGEYEQTGWTSAAKLTVPYTVELVFSPAQPNTSAY